jgi:hypothetical protein
MLQLYIFGNILEDTLAQVSIVELKPAGQATIYQTLHGKLFFALTKESLNN